MRVQEYSTAELERLTTLRFGTCAPGEVAYVPGGFGIFPQLRLTDGRITDADGCVGEAGDFLPVRRVRSLLDATELDPPQAEMLAELARRRTVISNATHGGRAVVVVGTRARRIVLWKTIADILQRDYDQRLGQYDPCILVWVVNPETGHIDGYVLDALELL